MTKTIDMSTDIINTERLNIRRFIPTDADAFKSLIRDKMSSPYAPYDEQFPTDDASLEGILGYFAASDEFFAIASRADNSLIGFISLNAVDGNTRNLGCCIRSSHQGRGYASEAARAAVSYARDTLGLSRLVSGTALVNEPATKLLQRLGFTETGRSEGSFISDAKGDPVSFIGASYELKL